MRNVMKSSIRFCRRAAVPTAALLLAGAIGPIGTLPNVQAASQASSPQTAEASPAALTSPAWSRMTDETQAVIKGNRVYYQSASGLVAADLSTGRTLWTYRVHSNAPVLTLNHSLYMVSTSGKLIKLNASTGKVLWSKKVPQSSGSSSDEYTPGSFLLHGSTLYLGHDTSVTKINAANGKVIRTLSDIRAEVIDIHGNKLIARTSVSGAYTRGILEAYDEATGKKLWEVGDDHYEILGYRGDYMYTQQTPFGIDQGYAATIDKVDLKTGKIVKSFEYLPVEFLSESAARKIIMSGDSFYIVQNGKNSTQIQRFPIDAPSDSQPDFVYKLAGSIHTFSVSGKNIAALLDQKTVVLDQQNGSLKAAVRTPTESKLFAYEWLTIEKDLLLVQAKSQIHGLLLNN